MRQIEIGFKPRRPASTNAYEGKQGLSENSELRRKEGRRQNTAPVDIQQSTDNERHGNDNQNRTRDSLLPVAFLQTVCYTVEQLTANRSLLVSDTHILVFACFSGYS